MEQLVPWVALLAVTVSASILAATGVGVWYILRRLKMSQEEHEDVYPQARTRTPAPDDVEESDVLRFVQGTAAMDQWALDEWIKERMEDDDWTEEDVEEYLDSREPIELF